MENNTLDTYGKLRSHVWRELSAELLDLMDEPNFDPLRIPYDILLGNAIDSLLEYDYACSKYFRLSPLLIPKYATKNHPGKIYKTTREMVTDAMIYFAFDTDMYNVIKKQYRKKYRDLCKKQTCCAAA